MLARYIKQTPNNGMKEIFFYRVFVLMKEAKSDDKKP